MVYFDLAIVFGIKKIEYLLKIFEYEFHSEFLLANLQELFEIDMSPDLAINKLF